MREASLLVLIPAFNEAASLPAVIEEVRRHVPAADILVVDDGSTDETANVLAAMHVRRVAHHKRQGVGAAMQTGLSFAQGQDYDVVVRVDGDGQHPASLIPALIAPLLAGDADAVMGSRYAAHRRPKSVPFARRLLHYALGRVLSRLAGRLVTDPTSGLWAFGPHAIPLLAGHHPPGYPEPELILLLSQQGLIAVEQPVEMRARFAGESSLTMRRTGAAMLRLGVLLAAAPFRTAQPRVRAAWPRKSPFEL